MKKNVKRITSLFAVLLLVLGMLAGCSAASDGAFAPEQDAEAEMDMSVESNKSEESMDFESMTPESSTEGSVSSNRKIIERVYFHVETKEFDDLLEALSEAIEKAGGYIESSSVSGNSYRYDGNRYAEYVIRIPSGKSKDFSEFVSANSTVTNKEISTDDVTLSYIDMESRVVALQTEKESLERLLEAAETLEDIIKIQDRLTDVIYEIESYQSQLRTYDNLIEYTTITINISEVEKVTIVEEQTVWEEIGTNLADNFSDVGQGFVDLFVFLVSNIPYILILAVIIVVVIIIVKRITKGPRVKRNRKKSQKENNTETYDKPEY